MDRLTNSLFLIRTIHLQINIISVIVFPFRMSFSSPTHKTWSLKCCEMLFFLLWCCHYCWHKFDLTFTFQKKSKFLLTRIYEVFWCMTYLLRIYDVFMRFFAFFLRFQPISQLPRKYFKYELQVKSSELHLFYIRRAGLSLGLVVLIFVQKCSLKCSYMPS